MSTAAILRSVFTRLTRQRKAILEALRAEGRPLRPEEILNLAAQDVPGLGIATVYRNIRELVEQGAIEAVITPGLTDRYELAGKEHHHHFLCRSCENLFEINKCLPTIDRLAPRGFQVDGHQLTLYGTCPGCSK